MEAEAKSGPRSKGAVSGDNWQTIALAVKFSMMQLPTGDSVTLREAKSTAKLAPAKVK